MTNNIDIRELKIGISKAGGNASASSKKHIVILPNKWAKEMGVEPDNRTIIAKYDSDKKEISIKLK